MRRFLLVPLLVAGTALTPAAAEAASLSLDRTCYVRGGPNAQQPIVATATGLTPGAFYNVGYSLKGQAETGYAFGTADATGSIILSINSYFAGSTVGPFAGEAEVVLREGATGPTLATSATRVTNAGVDAKGTKRNRRWFVTGLAPLSTGTTYWAHYLRGSKVKGSMKIGKPSGPCGVYRGRRPLTPFAKPGNYTLHITMDRRYDKDDVRLQARVYTYPI